MSPQMNEQTSLMADPNDGVKPAVLRSTFSPSDQHSSRIRSNVRVCWISLLKSVLMGIILLTLASWWLSLLSSPSSSSNTNSKYKKVQGLGFQIYTGGAPAFLENGQRNPECIGRAAYGSVVSETSPQLQCYVGHEDDPIQDVQQRWTLMKEALEVAYEIADSDSSILKIFVAPEFYWRGIDGAYRFADEQIANRNVCGPICHVLSGLETFLAKDDRFQDWLIVGGTILASSVLPTNDPYDYLFTNFAPVYKGGGKHGARFLLPKRYVSSSDFLTPQRHLNASWFQELIGEALPEHDTTVHNPFDFDRKRYDDSLWKEYKEELNDIGYSMIEYDWLMVDGLAVTLEICFDHQMRTALNTYLGDMITGRTTRIPSIVSSNQNGGTIEYVAIPPYQAQISVVSSAGMTVTPDSLVLTDQGVIFLQDGLNNDTNTKIWGTNSLETCEEDGAEYSWQFQGGTEAVQRRAFLSSTDVVLEHNVIGTGHRMPLFGPNWQQALEGSFSAQVYRPELVVFDPVDIAPVLAG